jgi:hypothetical protein
MTTPDFLAILTELTKFLLFPVFSITTSNFPDSEDIIFLSSDVFKFSKVN